MIRYKSFFILIAVAFLCMTVAFAAGDAAKGKEVYQKTCQKCHGADHKGNPAIAKSLKVEFKDLAGKEVQALKDDELKKLSIGPTGKKKPVKGVNPQQLDDVVSYIRTLKK
jgi:mono/diheme cytochrome c family protein